MNFGSRRFSRKQNSCFPGRCIFEMLFILGMTFFLLGTSACSKVEFSNDLEASDFISSANEQGQVPSSPSVPNQPVPTPPNVKPEPLILFQDNAQTGFTNRNGGGTKIDGVDQPYSLSIHAESGSENKKMIVVDRRNHRVLIFNQVPQASGALPDVVVGQSDFVSGSANAGGGISQMGLNVPVYAAACANGQFFVAERNNNRILGYNSVPTVNGAPADFVLGQNDFISSAAGAGRDGLRQPYFMKCIGEKFFVVDNGNNRVLVYNSIPTATGALPDFVIGQDGFDVTGVGCGENRFNNPYEIDFKNGRFYVADGNNNRLLVYEGVPADGNARPVYVYGQPDLTSCAFNQGNAAPSAQTVGLVNSVAVSDSHVAISDFGNRRILFFPVIAENNPLAIHQIGQADFTTAEILPPEIDNVSRVKSLQFVENSLAIWTTDIQNNRVMRLPVPDAGP